MEDNKKQIVAGAEQYACHVVKNIPQTDKNGKCQYYFSGSLAMLLLSSAKTIKPEYLSKDGFVESEQPAFSLSDKNKELLALGIRPVGFDVDVIAVDESIFAGKGDVYSLKTIREKCDKATTLCPKWEGGYGSMYFDWLGSDREFTGYDVAELEMQDGSKILVADPLCLAVHKLADSIKCKSSEERLERKGKLRPEKREELEAKYQKDIKDFTSLFNGIVSSYANVDFAELVEHVLETSSQTAFSDIMQEDSIERIKQFTYDASEYIDDEYQEMFTNFINAVGKQNKINLDKQAESEN